MRVTDAFGRASPAVSFTWTILPPLVIGATANQANTTGSAIAGLTLTATGGTGTGYQWSDPTSKLPPGLTIATVSGQGKVTGTPTAVGVYNVQLTVKDSTTTRSATISFTWTITYPPIAATNPGTMTSTVSTPDSLQLTATGGSGSYTWTGAATLPAGLTMTAGGLISGSPTHNRNDCSFPDGDGQPRGLSTDRCVHLERRRPAHHRRAWHEGHN